MFPYVASKMASFSPIEIVCGGLVEDVLEKRSVVELTKDTFGLLTLNQLLLLEFILWRCRILELIFFEVSF